MVARFTPEFQEIREIAQKLEDCECHQRPDALNKGRRVQVPGGNNACRIEERIGRTIASPQVRRGNTETARQHTVKDVR
ncbi:MAG TPA: hypothetical protein VHW71_02345 [Steroidobacteraceae bacterium]|nr:hypothetical protein [Steroidobacteraceae bacterium]